MKTHGCSLSKSRQVQVAFNASVFFAASYWNVHPVRCSGWSPSGNPHVYHSASSCSSLSPSSVPSFCQLWMTVAGYIPGESPVANSIWKVNEPMLPVGFVTAARFPMRHAGERNDDTVQLSAVGDGSLRDSEAGRNSCEMRVPFQL